MEFKSWEELTVREQLLTTISDVHKDVYGFRFRGNTDHMSDADLENFLNELAADAEADAIREREQEQEAAVRFEELVAEMISLGATDRETALRWLMDADEDSHYVECDPYYMNYRYGIPVNYDWKTGIQQAA